MLTISEKRIKKNILTMVGAFFRMEQRKEIKMQRIVGIVGCGVIGGALKAWIEKNTEHKVLVSDPPKGFNDDLSHCDVIFMSLHVPTEPDGSQDLTLYKSILEKLPSNTPIFIRTTILPGTSARLSKETGKEVYFMPEFLTERTSLTDFENQDIVFTAHVDLLKEIFPNKKYVVMSSVEAEIAKYVHNVFGALKVTYFNAVYDYCQTMGADYEKVRSGVLLSQYISPTHTLVPGPDGKFGYGGKCFPKDTNAFAKATENFDLGKILSVIPELNEKFRNKI